MTNVEWAAWVQAVGSVVAIFAAIAIAWWQHHKAENSRKALDRARAQSLALTLVPILRAYEGRVGQLVDKYGEQSINWQWAAQQVSLGDRLEDCIDRIHDLGEPAAAIHELVLYSLDARSVVFRHATEVNGYRPGLDPQPDDQVALNALIETRRRVLAALNAVEGLFRT